MPLGRGEVNEEGVAFYNRLIDALLANGITPWVTLYHWDLPLALQMEKDGLLNPEVADFFADYAGVCFARFGDRVKHWITLNEPWCSAVLGHGIGYFAPGRVSQSEPYVAAHNLIRAHGKIVDVYRRKFQAEQKGLIGITNNCDWREPKTDSAEDRAAAQRGLEFFIGWFADPIYHGDYPECMRSAVGERMPKFSEEDAALIRGSSDFFGLNFYGGMYAAEPPAGQSVVATKPTGNGGMSEDQRVELSDDPSWEKTDMDWNVVPDFCRKMLGWIDERYGHPPIYITENGCALPGEDDVKVAVRDERRSDFINRYLSSCHQAINEDGVDLRGYFVWTLMDNFEWASGYSKRFGLHHVDFATGVRTPKQSASWYTGVMARNGLE
jgi:beta-glucosidase